MPYIEQPNSRNIGFPITSWQDDPDELDISIRLTFGDSLCDIWGIDELSFDDKASIFLTKKDENKLYAFTYDGYIDGNDIDDVFDKVTNLKVSVSL